MSRVVIVGAGLAGLACARHLAHSGVESVVLEASDTVGGRVRTDVVDGMLLDRGFQVHNTGYPEAQRVLDHDALDLQPFTAGALVRYGDRLHRVGDPRRVPTWALSTLLAPIGSLSDKLAVAGLAAGSLLPPARLLTRPETTTAEALRRRGLSSASIDRFVRPFLSGVFLEQDLTTSSHVFDLIWRSFVVGTQCVPAAGMGAMPAQLATGLDVRLSTPVEQVAPRSVRAAGQRHDADAVVVATSGPQAAALVPTLAPPPMNSVTTDYHLAPEPPVRSPTIALDGEASGPVANSVVLTNAAPSYAPGRHLVSSSVVGPTGAGEPEVRAHLSRLYGVDTSGWEHVARYPIIEALPAQPPPQGRLRLPVRLEPGLYVCGDHRDSSSIQGALVSGRRAARAVLTDLGRD